MIPARKLLFHHPNVDDSVGTYVTDYVLSAVCFSMANVLLYKILKSHYSNTNRQRFRCSHFIPWRWPCTEHTEITMTTYSATVFHITYGVVALCGGLPHQYLQQMPNNVNGMRWLVSWRVAAGLAIGALCAILTLGEQLYQQEKFFRMPELGRKIFYILLYAAGMAAFIENFIRIWSPYDPYNITNLFVVFMAGIMLYGIGTLVLTVRSFVLRCERVTQIEEHTEKPSSTSSKSRPSLDVQTVRWDLILHCACPYIIVSGGIFSFILTDACSNDNAYEEHGCPLPDAFNHNAIMHLVHAVAMVCLGMGEVFAINRRQRIMEHSKYRKNLELLV